MPELNLQQATDLLGMFGGEDAAITVDYCPDGHAGAGIYAWHTDYPDEGFVLLMGEGGHRGRQAEKGRRGRRPAAARAPADKSVPLGRFTVLEVGDDMHLGTGVTLKAEGETTAFVPCERATAYACGQLLGEEVVLSVLPVRR